MRLCDGSHFWFPQNTRVVTEGKYVRNKLKRIRYDRSSFLFIAPFVIFAAVFMVYPIIQGFISSLYDTKWGNAEFVGLDNYIKIFTKDVYLMAIKNSLLYLAVVVPLLIIFGIWISGSVFDKIPRYVSFVRICLYIPVIASMVVMSIIWRFILDSQTGLVKYFSMLLGTGTVNLLESRTSALLVVMFILFTINIGQVVLLYIADMLGISKDLLEAATLDGVRRVDLFRYILIPLTKPTTVFVFITQVSSVLKVFIVIQLITKGGPSNGTTSMMYQLYQEAFVKSNTGVACALGVLLFLMSLVLILLRFAFDKKGRE